MVLVRSLKLLRRMARLTDHRWRYAGKREAHITTGFPGFAGFTSRILRNRDIGTPEPILALPNPPKYIIFYDSTRRLLRYKKNAKLVRPVFSIPKTYNALPLLSVFVPLKRLQRVENP